MVLITVNECIGDIHREIFKRCYNKKALLYNIYGAKGITVCDEWHDRAIFKSWALANGYKEGLKLRRYDSSKGYYPDNCYFGCSGKKSSARKIRNHRKSMKEMAGITGNYGKSRIYNIYNGMLQRCHNKNDYHYKYWGGRGIKVADEWTGKDGFFYFYKWAMENGYEDHLTIDRIDNNGDYSPDNCRWATPKQQTQNRRNNVLYEYKGKMRTVGEIAKMENVSKNMLTYRVRSKKMNIGDAIQEIRKIRVAQLFKEIENEATINSEK